MSPHDEQRFRDLIKNFVDGCGLELPLHLVTIAANGSVSVALHTDVAIEQIRSHIIEPGFVAPLTVTVIAPDGRGRSSRITIETARTMPVRTARCSTTLLVLLALRRRSNFRGNQFLGSTAPRGGVQVAPGRGPVSGGEGGVVPRLQTICGRLCPGEESSPATLEIA